MYNNRKMLNSTWCIDGYDAVFRYSPIIQKILFAEHSINKLNVNILIQDVYIYKH